MHINYLYLLSCANRFNTNKLGEKILDYGCGSGEVVFEGRKRGLNIYGVDVFYGGIFESFEKYFEINMIEDDYIKFRSKTSKITSWLIYFYRVPLAPLILGFLFKKLAGMVILARKKA